MTKRTTNKTASIVDQCIDLLRKPITIEAMAQKLGVEQRAVRQAIDRAKHSGVKVKWVERCTFVLNGTNGRANKGGSK